MKKRSLKLLPVFLVWHASLLLAQLPLPCFGTDPQPNDFCDMACIQCNLSGYQGTTAGFAPSSAPGFCGTADADQWIGFMAGAANVTFTITPSNCTNGNGVQAALYTSCAQQPLICNAGQQGGGSVPLVLSATGLQAGTHYYLMVDAFIGDQCDFTVAVDPPNGAQAQPLGNTGTISGPAQAGIGASVVYSVAPVANAVVYTWTAPPGALINGLPSPASIPAPAGASVTIAFGAQGGPVCVWPANVCQAGNQVCSTVSVGSVSSTAPIKEENAWSLWPNPAAGRFTVSWSDPVIEGWLALFDARGRCLERRVVPAGIRELEWPLDAYPAGLYRVVWQSAHGSSSRTVLIQPAER